MLCAAFPYCYAECSGAIKKHHPPDGITCALRKLGRLYFAEKLMPPSDMFTDDT